MSASATQGGHDQVAATMNNQTTSLQHNKLSETVTDCKCQSQTVTDRHRLSTDSQRLSQTVSVSHRLSQTVNRLSETVTDCKCQSQTVTDRHRLSETVKRLSQTGIDRHKLSQTVTDCQRLSQSQCHVSAAVTDVPHCTQHDDLAQTD